MNLKAFINKLCAIFRDYLKHVQNSFFPQKYFCKWGCCGFDIVILHCFRYKSATFTKVNTISI